MLWSENRPEWLRAYLAIAAGGMTAVPLDRLLNEAEVRYILDACEAHTIIASPGALATLSAEYRGALVARGVVLLDLERDLAPFADSPAHPAPPPAGSPDDRDPEIASLIFTSGTTGHPKGVLLTHANLLAVARGAIEVVDARSSDQLLSVLPLHHVFEFSVELTALLAGATISYIAEIKGELIGATMRATGTTIMCAVPRLLELLVAGIESKVRARGALAAAVFALLLFLSRTLRALGLDLRRRLFRKVHEGFGGHLRMFISGGAPLAPETWRQLDDLGVVVLEGYGLTETAPMLTGSRVGRQRAGSVGTAFPGVELRIAQASMAGEGEIVARGPGVMRGYFRDPEATAAVLRDGWFHTGDLGRIDAAGRVTITGRAKDLIVTPAGKNVSPTELEAIYKDAPGVQEICVFGVRVKGGEDVHAAVVVDPAVADARAVVAAGLERIAAGLPSYQRLQHVEILPELPKTTTLKVRRHEVRRLAAARRAHEHAPRPRAHDKVEAQVFELVRAVGRGRGRAAPIAAASTLQFDLGLDSLDRVELLAALEQRFGLHLPDGVGERVHRVQDLIDLVGDGGAPRAEQPAAPPAPASGLPLFRVAARMLYGLRGRGADQVPEGALILCPNHESHLDVFFVKSVLPRSLARRVVCFAKREHFCGRATRALARLAGAVPVDRDGDVRSALRAGGAALAAGRPLLIHPEGTRSKSGGLGPFRAGAALLAIEHQVPLVPVRLVGAHEIYPPSARVPRLLDWRRLRRLKLEVRFGAPILPPAPNGVPVKDAAEALTARLREEVARL